MKLTITSKRASARPFLILFELLFVIAVGWITVSIATDLAQSETVQQNRIAQDTAMMVNALVGAPGDSIVEYPANLTQYTLTLTSDAFIIRKTSEGQYDQTKATFYLPAGYIGQTQEGVIRGKQHVCLERTQRVITLRECSVGATP